MENIDATTTDTSMPLSSLESQVSTSSLKSSSTSPSSTSPSLTPSSLTMPLLTSEKSSLEYPSLPDPSTIQKQTEKSVEDQEVQKAPQKKNDKHIETNLNSKSSSSESDISSSPLITFEDWPKPSFTRSISENAVESFKVKPKKTFFRRTISDSGKKKQKDNKDKKDKKNPKRRHLWLRIKSRSSKKSTSEVVHVEGYYRESPLKESTNLSPLKGRHLMYCLDQSRSHIPNFRITGSGKV